MRILLINHYAGSPRHGMEFRPYYLAREWVAAGHTVSIVAASHSHLRQRNPSLGERPWLDEVLSGIHYRWLATPAYDHNGLERARNMAAFVWALWRMAPALARDWRPELVIASSTYPADIWPARRLARLAAARLVFEVHDLWPLSPMELGPMSRWHPFILLMQKAEDDAYRSAQRVLSILPKIDAHLASRGADPAKLRVIPNGVAVADWQKARGMLPAPLADALVRWRAQGLTVVGYAGSHGMANALPHLLAAAARLRQAPLVFVLVGQGPDKPALQAQAAALGLHNLHFFDAVARDAVPALLACFDIAYLGWQRQALYRFGIAPNKLGDYMMAACPVVHAVEAANDPVREARCGLSVPPADPEALAHALLSLSKLPLPARRALGARGREHVLRHLDYAVLAPRFLNACLEESP